MKKAARFILVFLCVAIFASLLLIAAAHDKYMMNTAPKAPTSVSFKPIESALDPTALIVELPKEHNAESVVVFFGNEEGRFEDSIGTFEVEENTAVCELDSSVVCPENTTMIWVYTSNNNSMSEDGCVLDLQNNLYAIGVDDNEEPAKKDESFEIYAVVTIVGAIALSVLGFVFLGKGKETPDGEVKEITNEQKDPS